MTREEAQRIVHEEINRHYQEPDDSLVILSEHTVEKPYGWVFFYQSKTFIDSGDRSFQLAGNGPIVVLAEDKSIHGLGSANTLEEEIEAFERRRGLV